MGYVDMGTLYSNFKMKKEMEARMDQIVKSKEGELQSLVNDLKKKIKNPNDSNKITTEFQLEKHKKANDTKEIASKYNDQIWKQLNQYIKEYSELNHYTVILGANGTGSVMAADSSINLTQSIISYANMRYNGSNSGINDVF
jgi:outer membrane protein